jgi:hypothetical protein
MAWKTNHGNTKGEDHGCDPGANQYQIVWQLRRAFGSALTGGQERTGFSLTFSASV